MPWFDFFGASRAAYGQSALIRPLESEPMLPVSG